MAASRRVDRRASRLLAALAGLLGGVFAPNAARAATLPEDRAEAMVHVYKGGGVTASGPAVLVRKNIADKVSLTGTYYLDAVSNASIDVVTTASPYKERRNDFGFALDYATRDSVITLGVGASSEPDYATKSLSLDIAQETFGGMTTVNLGFTRAADDVGKAGDPGFFDKAKHWQYRVGVTQILTPRWLASVNLEAVSDTGFLGNTYRVARVFGATVPERHPRTRSSRAIKFRAIGSLDERGSRDSVRAEYRYYWDTWDIKAHTVEAGYSRYVGQSFLADAFVRYYTQNAALFYSDNAQSETTYVSRNRQLSNFDNFVVGGKLTFDWKKQPGQYDLKANLGLELFNLKYKNFTDIRDGSAYSLRAAVLQLYMTATY